MNRIISSLLLFAAIFIIGCSRNHPSTSSLPEIDVTRRFSEREIVLTDIANVMYVHLDARNSDFLFRGVINYVTENTIVVIDRYSHSVLFFSKDGVPKSRFNRFGNGPEEYFNANIQVIYDEETDEVFVFAGYMPFIQVYSSNGKHKRRLNLPSGVMVSQMDVFDNQSLIVSDESRRLFIARPNTSIDDMEYLMDSPFFLICRTDGQVLHYIPMPTSQNDLSIRFSDGTPLMLAFTDIVRHADGFLLCNPATDTVFLFCRNKNLTPILWKTPPVNKLNPRVVLNNVIETENFQFFGIQTLTLDNVGRPRYYVRDKRTGRIYRQRIVLPDFQGKQFILSPTIYNFFHKNGTHIELDLQELKQAYRENRLRGELRELVSTLNEFEDNNVFALIHFK